MKRVHLQIIGNVQGVNFRYYLSKIARQAGVKGWVRNAANFSVVEALLEGEDSEVDRIVAWCRKGPPRAKVEEVKVVELVDAAKGKYPGELKGFEIR